ncbi:MAG: ATP-binding protein [Ancalomicrobiaceae bacterium]|nr:ATP-binding protein [Ancalomicrobiaceae bacterium]
MPGIDRPADLSFLPELLGFVETAAAAVLPPKAVMEVVLAAEEVLMNIITHAYPGGGGEVRIGVEFQAAPRALRLIVADDGIAFDPLTAPDPEIDIPLEQRQIGGLGILLAMRMMDQIVYERRGGENRLMMEKLAEKEDAP